MIVFEINTRCWLRELSDRRGEPVTLDSAPDELFHRWQAHGFTHIWLMGVWTTGPLSRAVAVNDPEVRRVCAEILPDWTDGDIAGSPYAIAAYTVPDSLGGDAGLRAFRQKLNALGLKLILDYIPNHVGLDHPWLHDRPELFVSRANEAPETFLQLTARGRLWVAHGKDPNFPAWSDTAQLDYRRRETHQAMTDELRHVAGLCDGVRCDMAMLVLEDIFARHWEKFPCATLAAAQEFWPAAIRAIKQTQPGFVFMAEVYWGLEARLQSLGFDAVYDKRVYDGLIYRHYPALQRYVLGLPRALLEAGIHFLENHDEPRIPSLLSPDESRAAALLVLGLPGWRLLYEGQLTGARLKIPVHLGRRPAELPQRETADFYARILSILPQTAVGRGRCELFRPDSASPGDPAAQSIFLVQWQARPEAFDLAVINLAAQRGQCYARLTIPGLAECNWQLRDLAGEEVHQRRGDDLQRQGLYLDLPPHGAQLFHFEPVEIG